MVFVGWTLRIFISFFTNAYIEFKQQNVGALRHRTGTPYFVVTPCRRRRRLLPAPSPIAFTGRATHGQRAGTADRRGPAPCARKAAAMLSADGWTPVVPRPEATVARVKTVGRHRRSPWPAGRISGHRRPSQTSRSIIAFAKNMVARHRRSNFLSKHFERSNKNNYGNTHSICSFIDYTLINTINFTIQLLLNIV